MNEEISKPESLISRCSLVTGPTGSGKSAYAFEWARSTKAELVLIDSMTLYRGMDIGTAKPNLVERREIPHHMLDLLEMHEDASAGWWLAQATKRIDTILRRGGKVILVGGTALYLQLLFYGLGTAPIQDPVLRQKLETEAISFGSQFLHQRLGGVDPVAASKIHPNDTRRIIRALEVYEITGQPISSFQGQWSQKREPLLPESGNKWICLGWPREELKLRIAKRTEAMLKAGWLQEVQSLAARNTSWGKTAGQAVGYQLLLSVLQGEISLSVASQRIIEETSQVAKHQETWFKRWKSLEKLEGSEVERNLANGSAIF